MIVAEAPQEVTLDELFTDGAFSSERYVRARLRVERPDLFELVKEGALSLPRAMAEAWGCGCDG